MTFQSGKYLFCETYYRKYPFCERQNFYEIHNGTYPLYVTHNGKYPFYKVENNLFANELSFYEWHNWKYFFSER